MSPLEPEKSNPWVKQIEDAIASNSALREGLHDNEAMPLIDWGAERAQQIGQRMAAQATVAPDSEEVAETAYTLGRLMTRITWVVVYRNKKDAAWLTRTFNTINQLSQELYGPDAATLSEAEIADWIATHSQFSNGELVKQLIEQGASAKLLARLLGERVLQVAGLPEREICIPSYDQLSALSLAAAGAYPYDSFAKFRLR